MSENKSGLSTGLVRAGFSGATEQKPVIVIGAGIAGSTAAWTLQKRGIPVRLLEKTSHIGGRIQTEDQNGCKFESGMQFYYSWYREARQLLREMNLEQRLYPAPVYGYMTWEGKTATFDKGQPWLGLMSAGDNFKLWKSVAKRAGSLLGQDVFRHIPADRMDQVDVAQYFRAEASDPVLELAVRPMVTSYSFAEPEGHSMAMLLKIIKLGAAAKTLALVEGNDALPKAMASRVKTITGEATAIRTINGVVRGVEYKNASGASESIDTEHVICAAPPPSGQALFDGLPVLQGMLRKIDYTSTIMVNFFLDRALPAKGWVYVLSRHDGHRAAFAIDCMKRCPPAFPDGKSVIMVSFVNPLAKQYLGKTDEELTKICLEDMKIYLPDLAAMTKKVSVVRRAIAVPTFQTGMFAQIRDLEQESLKTPGLNLVGDYLRSPLCEGAVRSALGVTLSG